MIILQNIKKERERELTIKFNFSKYCWIWKTWIQYFIQYSIITYFYWTESTTISKKKPQSLKEMAKNLSTVVLGKRRTASKSQYDINKETEREREEERGREHTISAMVVVRATLEHGAQQRAVRGRGGVRAHQRLQLAPHLPPLLLAAPRRLTSGGLLLPSILIL